MPWIVTNNNNVTIKICNLFKSIFIIYYIDYIDLNIYFLEVIFLDNFNIDSNSINKLKDMMNKGELSDVISQIPPEMIQNFSNMMSSNNSSANGNSSNFNNNSSNSDNGSSSNSSSSENSNSNFDFSKIDMNTIMKMKSIMDKMNNTNDPRANLLNSLKPYLREEKKSKLDQYANLMNVAKIAELFNNKENNSND